MKPKPKAPKRVWLVMNAEDTNLEAFDSKAVAEMWCDSPYKQWLVGPYVLESPKPRRRKKR